MELTDLDYDLPPGHIARHPARPRDHAKLMVIRRPAEPGDKAVIEHRQVYQLPELNILQPGDLIVLNHSRVVPAYFVGIRAATGGKVKGLFLNLANEDERVYWHAMFETRGRLEVGEVITLNETARLVLVSHEGGGVWQCLLEADGITWELLASIGRPPLPPYIRKARRTAGEPEIHGHDDQSYNTVYAARPGSVAAPTAGLHFTEPLLQSIRSIGVNIAILTLHVGLGTFNPIRTSRPADHIMHNEWLEVPRQTLDMIRQTRRTGGRIFAVGTTVVRALESLPDPIDEISDDYTSHTSLFIYPGSGMQWRFTDRLLTNFHLPRSTLLALVASLPGVGLDNLKHWYQQAIEQDYRFYSYGDAMLIV